MKNNGRLPEYGKRFLFNSLFVDKYIKHAMANSLNHFFYLNEKLV
jgi:hypothetical protein